MAAVRGALFLSGAFAANWTALEHRFVIASDQRLVRLPCGFLITDDHPQDRPSRTASDWWTGKDSNLRSPQGAADLQSAGFSHSPTRPAKTKRTLNTCPLKLLQANPRSAKQKHKKDSCQKTPARLFFLQGFAPPHSPAESWWSWRRELNPRPSDYKSDALPAELRQRRSNRVRIAEGVRELQVGGSTLEHVGGQDCGKTASLCRTPSGPIFRFLYSLA
jgi:hypothetical protein